MCDHENAANFKKKTPGFNIRFRAKIIRFETTV